MVKYFCDRCEKELDEEEIYHDNAEKHGEGVFLGIIQQVARNKRYNTDGFHYGCIDLCKDCQKKLDLFVNTFMDNRID